MECHPTRIKFRGIFSVFMQKTIDQITDYLAGLVTADRPCYTPKELLRAKIPSFIVERIRLYLEDKIQEDLTKVSSQWYNHSAKLVNEAWEDYLRSALSYSHIPKDQLYTILNNVVSDIIYVFIEPRKHMANYVFREDEELSLEELEHRCARLTVYKHFGTAIPLYMKKRALETLTKERCKLLIHKLDAKLVAAYSAQDWAQKLEQLFLLFGGKVEPKLLATFFEDKGLPNMAHKFTNKRKLISKADFIYIISTKEEEVIEAAPTETEPKGTHKEQEQSLIESFFGEYSDNPEDSKLFNDSIAGQYLEGGLSDDEMNELLEDIASDGVIEVEDGMHVASLNELFLSEKEEENSISETSEEIAASIRNPKHGEQEEIKEFRENLISILDQAKDSFKNVAGEKESPSAEPFFSNNVEMEENEGEGLSIRLDEEMIIDDAPEPIFEETNDEADQSGDDEIDPDKPMWAQFLSPDQMDIMMGGKRSDNRTFEEANDDDDVLEIEDVFAEDEVFEGSNNHKEEELQRLLFDRREEFIEVIFKGSETAYEKHLKDIADFEDWKETSAFIQTQIFKINDVDLFSGATVDFTDRMHQYFNERTNS